MFGRLYINEFMFHSHLQRAVECYTDNIPFTSHLVLSPIETNHHQIEAESGNSLVPAIVVVPCAFSQGALWKVSIQIYIFIIEVSLTRGNWLCPFKGEVYGL